MGKGDKKTKKGKIFKGTFGKSRNKKIVVKKSKNMICYMSNEVLTKENMSLEHIIPNALGGKLKSFHLINKKWNDIFGKNIDRELAKQMPLSTLLNVKRDRGNNGELRAATKDGIGYLVNKKLQGKRQFIKPKTIKLPNGGEKIEFIEGQEEQILKSIKKKNPKVDINELRKMITWNDKDKGKEQLVFFDNHLSLIQGPEAFKTICKIACNYYVFGTNETTQIQGVLPFLKGTDKGWGTLKYFYSSNKIHELGNDEISHVIHIRGKSKEKLLYAYVELFSCHSFLVILNNDYTGKDIQYTYCYDVNNNKEINKKVNLNLTKAEIKNMNFPVDEDSEKEYFKRLDRIAKIKGWKMDIKNIKELK